MPPLVKRKHRTEFTSNKRREGGKNVCKVSKSKRTQRYNLTHRGGTKLDPHQATDYSQKNQSSLSIKLDGMIKSAFVDCYAFQI